jgi:hypothetical protein
MRDFFLPAAALQCAEHGAAAHACVSYHLELPAQTTDQGNAVHDTATKEGCECMTD